MGEFTELTAVAIILMAFFAEYIDSTLGMGYGTSLTPLLMLVFGFDPLHIVPAVLLSELLTGISAAILHNTVGNVTLMPKGLSKGDIFRKIRQYGVMDSFRRAPLHLHVSLILGLCSVVGAVISVLIAIQLPKVLLHLYIGCLVLSIGIFIILTINKTIEFSWKRIVGLGLLASFNKGLSGGGYGPVVTGGQLLSGLKGKNAVGITSLAEAITCMVGLSVYALGPTSIHWKLSLCLLTGGLLSVPLSALTVKKIPGKRFQAIVGIATIILGTLTLSRLFP